MNELLSQEEIDALLGVFDESEESTVTIRKSDTLNPLQMQALLELHLELAERFADALNALLRSSFKLSVEVIEERITGEAPSEQECYTFAFSPYTGANRICIENAPALALLERLLGGEGRLPPSMRPLSAMEKLLFERFWQLFRDALNLVWQRREAVSVMPLDSIKEHEQKGIRVSLAIVSDEASGALEILYDVKTLRGLLLGMGRNENAEKEDEQVFIEADLGTAYLSAEEIEALQGGDVIPLETAALDMVTVHIDGEVCCLGEIVKDDTGALEVRITKRVAKNRAKGGAIALRARIGTATLTLDDFMQLQYETPIVLEQGEALEIIADDKVIAQGKGIVLEGSPAVEIVRVKETL